MRKIAIIGAGNVGGLTAMRIVEENLADVALIDVAGNLARAKALDIEDSLATLKTDRKISGTDDFSLAKDADIVVITAGFSRRPGMLREELIEKNAAIVKSISERIKQTLPGAIVIVVTNPVDIMTYLACKTTGWHAKRIFGMGPNLDTARFVNIIAQKMNAPNACVSAQVIGMHGEEMLPLSRFARVNQKNISELLTEAELNSLTKETVQRGATIVSLYGNASAYFGPSQAIVQIIKAIIEDEKIILPVTAFLNGEYGLRDIFLGVPAKIGKEGIEEIIELDLKKRELDSFHKAAEVIREGIRQLKNV